MAASIGAGLLGVSACGGSQSPGSAVVVKVNGHAITKASLEHWTRIEGVLGYAFRPDKPVPKGVVPDPPDFADCVAYLRSLAPASRVSSTKAATGQLKRQCQQRYKSLQDQVLEVLIKAYWWRGEAAARGITVTEAEVGQTLQRLFPRKGSLEQFVALTGETVAEQRFLLAGNLLGTKLQTLLEKSFAARGLTGGRLQRQLVRASVEYFARWRARTDCRPKYLVQECRQYRGPPA